MEFKLSQDIMLGRHLVRSGSVLRTSGIPNFKEVKNPIPSGGGEWGLDEFEDGTGPFIYESPLVDIGTGINTWMNEPEGEGSPACVIFYYDEFHAKYLGRTKQEVNILALKAYNYLDKFVKKHGLGTEAERDALYEEDHDMYVELSEEAAKHLESLGFGINWM